VAIGQGALTVSPLQLARAYSGIAMGGKWRKPHLTKTPGQPDKPVEWGFTADNWKDVIDGMYGVVNEGGGTGVRAQLPHDEVCGKTGTAQLASNDFLKGTAAGQSQNMKDNAWFVALPRGRRRKLWWWRCSSMVSMASSRRPLCAMY